MRERRRARGRRREGAAARGRGGRRESGSPEGARARRAARVGRRRRCGREEGERERGVVTGEREEMGRPVVARVTSFADGRGHRQSRATWPGPQTSPLAGHRQKPIADGFLRPSAKKSFFLFFPSQFFSGVFPPQIQATSKVWDNFELFSYISLIISVSFNVSRTSRFELQVHEIMQTFDSKNDIHDSRSMLRPYPGACMKLRPCWPRNMGSDVSGKCFKIL